MSETNPPLPLVLLPGVYGSGELFPPFIERLRPGVRAVTVGFPNDRVMTYQQLLPLVLETVDRVGPCAVLGESFSAPLSVMAAAVRPDTVRAVVMSAGFIRNPALIRWQALRHLVRGPVFRHAPVWLRDYAVMGRHATPALRALALRAMESLPAWLMAQRVRESLRVDVREQLRALRVPLLYLQAADDRVVHPRNAREIVALYPVTRVVTFDAPHLLLQTRPDETAEVVCEFLAASSDAMPAGQRVPPTRR